MFYECFILLLLWNKIAFIGVLPCSCPSHFLNFISQTPSECCIVSCLSPASPQWLPLPFQRKLKLFILNLTVLHPPFQPFFLTFHTLFATCLPRSNSSPVGIRGLPALGSLPCPTAGWHLCSPLSRRDELMLITSIKHRLILSVVVELFV